MKNHPNITFGSYPSWSGQHYRTKVTFEGENEEEVSRARSDMEELKPVKFDPKPTENAWEKVQQFLQDTADSHMTEVVEGSLKVVEECFARYSHLRVHSKVGEYPLVFKCSCSLFTCFIRFTPDPLIFRLTYECCISNPMYLFPIKPLV